MDIQQQIQEYIDSQSEPKRTEMGTLHQLILELEPTCQQWFETGKNNEGKVISNPNIGYGLYTIQYANGTSREFFRIGMSANTTGISVYIMGLKDKKHLINAYSERIGKASVTGYCIKFKTVKAINVDVLLEAVKFGFEVD